MGGTICRPSLTVLQKSAQVELAGTGTAAQLYSAVIWRAQRGVKWRQGNQGVYQPVKLLFSAAERSQEFQKRTGKTRHKSLRLVFQKGFDCGREQREKMLVCFCAPHQHNSCSCGAGEQQCDQQGGFLTGLREIAILGGARWSL